MYICKGYRPFVNLHECLALEVNFTPKIRVLFFFRSSFVEEVLPTMVKKTMDHHVLPNLASTTVVSTSFDLWMSHGVVNILFWFSIF